MCTISLCGQDGRCGAGHVPDLTTGNAVSQLIFV